ncbi:MAG: diadenylate cyclase CdaA [bacterium]
MNILDILRVNMTYGKILLSIVDVLAVSYILYRLLLLVQGTRSVQVIIGMVFLVFVFVVAQAVRLTTLAWMLRNLVAFGVIAFFIIFQPEMRRALAHIGQSLFLGRPVDITEETIRNITRAAEVLSKSRTGALIVLERETGLRNYLETGKRIDALVSTELIISIFGTTSSPLHDGAIIINENRIAGASCFLPLAQQSEVTGSLGTRHRAAIGLTEESDAIVVVVSEETGKVSLAVDGKLEFVTIPTLYSTLREIYKIGITPQRGRLFSLFRYRGDAQGGK